MSNAASRDEAWEVNVRGTRRVLDAAEAHGARRFVHLSSVAALPTRIAITIANVIGFTQRRLARQASSMPQRC